jgi:hypothetical protein
VGALMLVSDETRYDLETIAALATIAAAVVLIWRKFR